MTGLPWFKCYPRDFNEGMIGLTMEERGAYITLLNLIYAKGGPVEDDAGYFRMVFCCSLKAWTKVRAALIVKRKVFAIDINGEPCLMNQRAAVEIAEAEGKSQKFSEAGRKGGKNSHVQTKENNDLGKARLEPGLSTTDTEHRKTPDTPSGVSRPKAAKGSRRVPVDWMPKPSHYGLGASEGFNPGEIERELSKFRDHEFRTPHVDWDATFRKWLMTAAEHRPRNERPNQPSAKLVARQDNLARSFAGAQLAAERRAVERAGGS